MSKSLKKHKIDDFKGRLPIKKIKTNNFIITDSKNKLPVERKKIEKDLSNEKGGHEKNINKQINVSEEKKNELKDVSTSIVEVKLNRNQRRRLSLKKKLQAKKPGSSKTLLIQKFLPKTNLLTKNQARRARRNKTKVNQPLVLKMYPIGAEDISVSKAALQTENLNENEEETEESESEEEQEILNKYEEENNDESEEEQTELSENEEQSDESEGKFGKITLKQNKNLTKMDVEDSSECEYDSSEGLEYSVMSKKQKLSNEINNKHLNKESEDDGINSGYSIENKVLKESNNYDISGSSENESSDIENSGEEESDNGEENLESQDDNASKYNKNKNVGKLMGDTFVQSNQKEFPKSETKVVIKNLPENVTEDLIRETFGFIEEIKSVYLPWDRNENKPKKFAFMEMSDKDAAQRVVELSDLARVGDNIVIIKEYVEFPVGSRGGGQRSSRGYRGWGRGPTNRSPGGRDHTNRSPRGRGDHTNRSPGGRGGHFRRGNGTFRSSPRRGGHFRGEQESSHVFRGFGRGSINRSPGGHFRRRDGTFRGSPGRGSHFRGEN